MKNTHKTLLLIGFIFCMLFTIACEPKPAAANLVVSPPVLTLRAGETFQLDVTLEGAQVVDATWKSSNTSAVTVNETGLLTGIFPGTATITATNAEGRSGLASVTVLPGHIVLDASDVIISNETPSGYSYKFFSSEAAFVEEVRAFLPTGTAFKLSDLTVSEIKFPDTTNDSFLQEEKNESLFEIDSPFPTTIFSETEIAGAPATTYSKKIEFTLKFNDTSIPFVWNENESVDTFTLPNEGEVKLGASDFKTSEISQTSFLLTFLGIQNKVIAAYEDAVESGSGNIAIDVLINETSKGSISGRIENGELEALVIDGLDPNTAYSISFEVSLSLDSGNNPTLINDLTLSVKTLPAGESLTISPLHLSIARKTSDSGVPEAKVTALFNYAAEMEVALKGLLGNDFNLYDFSKATWSATFIDSDNGDDVATVVDAPYTKRTEFTLDLNKNYQLSFVDSSIVAPKKTDENEKLVINLSLSGDAEHADKSKQYWGSTFRVLRTAEFPQTVYFNNDFRSKSDTPTEHEYSLIIGDDFNYHFNGLNYKSYSNYDTLKTSASLDYEAYAYNRMWRRETEGRAVARRIFSWDLRTTETKNSIMLQKALAANSTTGVIYLGPNRTKPLDGFIDLFNKGGETSIQGESMSDSFRFGYAEAKIRIKQQAYHSGPVGGPWYAFWSYGSLGEFDMMEFPGNSDRRAHSVTHWHNSGFGNKASGGSAWVEFDTPVTQQTEWFTLGLFWSEDRVIYYYNGAPYRDITANANNTGFTANNSGSVKQNSGSGSRTDMGGTDTSFGVDKNVAPQLAPSAAHIPYGSDKLKGVLDDPQHLYISVENSDGGWGGYFNDGYDKLPTWMEVEYVAYYKAVDTLLRLEIPTDTTNDLLVGNQLPLTVNYFPSSTSETGVTWASSDSSVASVDPTSGVVTAEGAGKASITATSTVNSAISVSVEVNVVSTIMNVTAVNIVPAVQTVQLGADPFLLSFEVLPPNASIKTVTWSSSDDTKATVDSDGLVSVKNILGDVTITATSDENDTIDGSCVISIVPISVTGLTLSANSETLAYGSSELVGTFIEPEDATVQALTWESSNEGVLLVDATTGLVTAVGEGSATITATTTDGSNIEDSITFSVDPEVLAADTLSLSGSNYNLVKAYNFQEDDSTVTIPEGMTKEYGLLKTTPNLKDNYTLNFSGLPDYDYISIRLKEDYNQNMYINANGWNYQFSRSNDTVWTVDDTWGGSSSQASGWTIGNAWNNYGILNDATSSVAYYLNEAQSVSTNTTSGANFGESINFIFVEQASGNVGNIEIEYVAFYKFAGTPEVLAPEAISLDGNEYVQVRAYDFHDDETFVTPSWATKADGKLTTNSSSDNTYSLTISELPDYDYISIRLKDGYNQNLYYNTNGWNYQFSRIVNGVVQFWTVSDSWTGDRTNASGWSLGAGFNNIGVMNDGASAAVYYLNEAQPITSQTPGVSFGPSITLIMGDGSASNPINVEIEYIAFYKRYLQPTAIEISGDTSDIAVNTSRNLSATLTPANASGGVTWSVEPADLATITESGVLTAGAAAGEVTITVTAGHNTALSDSITINIAESEAITGLTLSATSSLMVEHSATLPVTFTPADTLQTGVTWASSSPANVSINATTGLMKGLVEGGTSVITVTSTVNTAFTASCTVTVTRATEAPATFSTVGEATLPLMKAFNMDGADSSLVLPGANWTLNAGYLNIDKSGGANGDAATITGFSNASVVAIRVKSSGFSPNFDYFNGFYYNFHRVDTTSVNAQYTVTSVIDAEWQKIQPTFSQWAHQDERFDTYYIYRNGTSITYGRNNEAEKTGDFPTVTPYTDNWNFFFRDNFGENTGSVSIEYIAFYGE